MKKPSLNFLADTAIEAARLSGEVLLKYFKKELRIAEKEGAGLVTQVDLESQDTCVNHLRSATPEFGFLTEEAKPEKGECPGRWIIDPLDGTTNYVHGFPMFCVSIAAEWENDLLVGIIHHPILNETYVAVRGEGAWLNQSPIRASKTKEVRNSLLTTGFTYQKEESLRSEMTAFSNLSAVARAVRRPGSAALDLAYTASGVFDGFWERGLSPWDVAAGVLLVQEAGGDVSDFRGNPYTLRSNELLASNGLLHQKLLQSISGNDGFSIQPDRGLA